MVRGGNSRDFMYTVLGSVLGAVLPFEETKTGRDSRLSCFLSFRLPSPLGRTTFLGNRTRDSWDTVISRARGAFSPQRGVKSHVPRSWRILRKHGSDSRSRSPLSIRALRSPRNARIRLLPNIVSNIVSKFTKIFPVQSCPLARLVQDDGSRKLPQITKTCNFN